MNRHPITWTQPSPFWTETTLPAVNTASAEFARPAILRFTSDSFMDDLLNVLATDPRRLGEYRVRPETWRGFTPLPAPLVPKKIFALPFQRLGTARKSKKNGSASLPTKPPPAAAPDLPLKLYAPAAQRYYFVGSCLVCQTPGLPDRHIEPGRGERVSFLVRRLFPPGKDATRPKAEWEEHAWVQGPGGNFWQKLTPGEIAKPGQGEERLPMFALNFKADDLRDRRLLAGLIPVGKREAYLGGPLGGNGAGATGTTVKTARKILFRKEIAEPWKALIAQAARAAQQLADLAPPSLFDRKAKIAVERSTLQLVSWLVLLDFDRFLSQYLPGVHAAIQGQAPNPPLTPEQNTLLTSLGQIKVIPPLLADLPDNCARTTVSGTMIEALKQIGSFAQKLEQTTTEYDRRAANTDYPNFLFPLADLVSPAAAPLPSNSGLTAAEIAELAAAADPAHPEPGAAVDNLTVLVVRALPASPPAAEPAVPPSALAPADALDGWFVLRCAYERPACGPLHQDVVSPRTEPFQLAGFFDPDAPARPIRIGLPLDISPAGLRKFDKNTAFVMSDMLCGQVARFKGITFGDLIRSVLPFPLHKDLSPGGGGPCSSGSGSIGTICSLSIPIITICALILLIIIVTLLDIIFHWLPFFIFCFPIPGLKGKK